MTCKVCELDERNGPCELCQYDEDFLKDKAACDLENKEDCEACQ